MVFGVRHGRTILTHAYVEPPLRVSRTLPWGDGAHVMLASSAPGLFGGDLFEQVVSVERGARVHLTSQSALQVHPAVSARTGILRSRFDVDDDAELSCYWDPVIPFAGSRLLQQIEIRLASSARLTWSDAFMAGRAGSGERWRFSSLGYELRVTRAAELEYLERYRLEPAEATLDARWMASDCCYLGTAIASGDVACDRRAEALHEACGRFDGLSAAVDRLGPRLLLARFAASHGPSFHEARALVRDTLAGCGRVR
jgi:urease accessory protein